MVSSVSFFSTLLQLILISNIIQVNFGAVSGFDLLSIIDVLQVFNLSLSCLGVLEN